MLELAILKSSAKTSTLIYHMTKQSAASSRINQGFDHPRPVSLYFHIEKTQLLSKHYCMSCRLSLRQLHGLNQWDLLTQSSDNISSVISKDNSNTYTTRSIKKCNIKVTLIILLRWRSPTNSNRPSYTPNRLFLHIEMLRD